MMTIAQRVVTLQMCAKVAKGDAVRKLLEETALVLEGLAVQYNRLHAAAVDTIRRSNGEDPAMNILCQEVREQMGEKRR